ncbi:MAG: hypothetical protein PVF58_08880 [Candidatus Methanofastidiosia archaeon]|jgi:hypothetical protein
MDVWFWYLPAEFLIIEILVTIPFILFFIYFFRKRAKEREKTRENIIETKADYLSQGRWFPVRYCSENRFKKILKLFPWEATGILVIKDTEIKFFCNVLAWENLELTFDSERGKTAWIGKNIWPNGVTSWFFIDSDDKKHYFTSETGAFIFGSENTTRRIYDEVKKVISDSDSDSDSVSG